MEIVPGTHKIEDAWDGNIFLIIDGSDVALVDKWLAT